MILKKLVLKYIIKKHLTDFNEIDWIKNKRAIIKRIFERGNDVEINEIINFYGKETVKKELEDINDNFLQSFDYNVNKYLESE